MNSHIPKKYKPSGRFPLAGLVKLASLGLLASVILSILYIYGLYLIPLVWVRFLLTFGFAWCLGFILKKIVHKSHIRNPLIVIATGIVVGISANYIQWSVHFTVISGWSRIIFEPEVLVESITRLSQLGSWSFMNVTPRGIFLLIVWGIEASVIVGGAVFGPWSEAAKPYCENCERWANGHRVVGPFTPVEDKRALQKQLRSGDFTGLRNLMPATEERQFTNVHLLECGRCAQFNLLSVVETTVRKNTGGEVEIDEHHYVSNLVVDPHVLGLIGKQEQS